MKKIPEISTKKRIGIGVVLVIILGLLLSRMVGNKNQQPSFTTAVVEKGTLTKSVSAAGTVLSGNSVSITTAASGMVSQVYVKNGAAVRQGQKIAELILDQESKQKQAQAYASYLSAVNSVKSAEQNKLLADAQMWQSKQALLDAENTVNAKNDNNTNPSTRKDYTDLEKQSIDSALTQAQKSFTVAELKYKEADSAIASARANVSSSWLSYQQLSSVVTAPIDGVIRNLTISPGSTLVSTQSTEGISTAQSLGMVTKSQSKIQVMVDLTEIDVVHVKPDQKVSITVDALPAMTFTGRVLAINTNGQSNSGVTTYPATIELDNQVDSIYPKMAVNANIITDIAHDVLIVPIAAVQTAGGNTMVRVMKNGRPEPVKVETGLANDTQIVITSGLSESDQVITGSATPTTRSSGQTVSPFGLGNRGIGGGSPVRIQR